MAAADLRPDLSSIFSAFGVDCTVTPKFAKSFSTVGIWEGPTFEDLPEGDDASNRSPRRTMSFDASINIELGFRVQAPERPGGPIKNFIVDGYVGNDQEILTVKLKPVVS